MSAITTHPSKETGHLFSLYFYKYPMNTKTNGISVAFMHLIVVDKRF